MEEMNQPKASRALMRIQRLLGVGVYTVIALPYLRRTHALERLRPGQHYLFVCNHVSLLDTVLLGAVAWRHDRLPILVLGDKAVWQVSRLKRFLSSHIGFLLERGKLNPHRIRELQMFARASRDFDLIVFPEGTRGDGVNIAECQPGVYYIAQEARVPIVPIFIENMQFVSTKTGRFHPIGGLRKVEVHYGEPIEPETYLSIPRREFTEFVRQRISALRPTQPAEHLSPVLHRG
jgi:1-acyl-sn-glycerol-3-phosphate acyltransferase